MRKVWMRLKQAMCHWFAKDYWELYREECIFTDMADHEKCRTCKHNIKVERSETSKKIYEE